MGVTVANAEDLTMPPRTSVTPDTLPPTLDTVDLVIGQGPEATESDKVEVRYQGVRVSDGKEFESSWSTGGTTTEFPLRSVIDGFRLGIPGMREGGRRVLVVPPHQGFGAAGVPPAIPPGAHVVYVVDLVTICPRPAS